MRIARRKRRLRWDGSVPYVNIHGHRQNLRSLLQGGESNVKMAKEVDDDEDWEVWGLSLAPEYEGGFGTVCAHAGSCVRTCLTHTGNGYSLPSVQLARVAKTAWFFQDMPSFLSRLNRELTNKARGGAQVGCRLNVYSDVPWERLGVIDKHPSITFYDYTKNPKRAGWIRPNYYTTFSYDPAFPDRWRDVIDAGHNVAVAFDLGHRTHNRPMPTEWNGYRVINGDTHDLRFLDPQSSGGPGYIVGLRFKYATNAQYKAGIESGMAVRVA